MGFVKGFRLKYFTFNVKELNIRDRDMRGSEGRTEG